MTTNCPSCGKELHFERTDEHPSFPFCSRKCRLVDLGKWFDESYSFSRPVEGEELETAEELQNPEFDPDGFPFEERGE